MNGKQKIEEMSNEALLKRKKETDLRTGVLAGILMGVLFMAGFFYGIYGIGISVSWPLLIMLSWLFPILWKNAAEVKAVKKELRSRSLVA